MNMQTSAAQRRQAAAGSRRGRQRHGAMPSPCSHSPAWGPIPRAGPLAARRLACRAGEEAAEIPGEAVAPLKGLVYRAGLGEAEPDSTFPLTCPLLPFGSSEVLLPGQVKSLHLFEARYLALLDEVLATDHKLFAHVTVDRPPTPGCRAPRGSLVGQDFVMSMNSLVRVLEVTAMERGALVRIQAEARVGLVQISKLDPYMVGVVVPLLDEPVDDSAGVEAAAAELRQVMRDAQNFAAKFNSKQTKALQRAMLWAGRAAGSAGGPGPAVGGLHPEDWEHEAAWRLSFAALQALPESSEEEQQRLLAAQQEAMRGVDLLQRLVASTAVMSEAGAMLRARCALKSINMIV